MFDLERQLKAVQAEYRNVMEKDVPAFNEQIQAAG